MNINRSETLLNLWKPKKKKLDTSHNADENFNITLEKWIIQSNMNYMFKKAKVAVQ